MAGLAGLIGRDWFRDDRQWRWQNRTAGLGSDDDKAGMMTPMDACTEKQSRFDAIRWEKEGLKNRGGFGSFGGSSFQLRVFVSGESNMGYYCKRLTKPVISCRPLPWCWVLGVEYMCV